MNLRSASLFLLLFQTSAFGAPVPLKDGVLFAFERCKTLSVDLQRGQLKEAASEAFDLHCKRTDRALDLRCEFFDPGGTAVKKVETFAGGSELGVATLTAPAGLKLRFLIGKSFAAYESGPEQKVCAGIYLFEEEARKQKPR